MKIDARVIKTKEKFKEALKELILDNENIEEISVKKLCEKANLNRGTFYLHYNNVDDVLNEIMSDFTSDLNEKSGVYNRTSDIRKFVELFFEMAKENPYFEKIITTPHNAYLNEKYRKIGLKQLDEHGNFNPLESYDSTTRNILEKYFHNTLTLCFIEWVRNNRVIPYNEIIDLTVELISNGIKSIMKQ